MSYRMACDRSTSSTSVVTLCRSGTTGQTVAGRILFRCCTSIDLDVFSRYDGRHIGGGAPAPGLDGALSPRRARSIVR